MVDDFDGFWDVALSEPYQQDHPHQDEEEDPAEADVDIYHTGHQKTGGKVTSYHLPWTSITLELAQLPPKNGVWAPVGGDVWYASALLTSLILGQATSTKTLPKINTGVENLEIFPRRHDLSKPFRILELGSGAKALSGFAAAAALTTMPGLFPSWTVTLTDNEGDVLNQLSQNAAANQSKIISIENENNQHINVKYLDWGIDADDQYTDQHCDLLDADVVIGSELAYTEDTATALANLLSTLLNRNANVSIWIVQVIDRCGWNEIVLPSLESQPDVAVEIIPLGLDVHDTASKMVPMGGALDRYAFGAVKISHVVK